MNLLEKFFAVVLIVTFVAFIATAWLDEQTGAGDAALIILTCVVLVLMGGLGWSFLEEVSKNPDRKK